MYLQSYVVPICLYEEVDGHGVIRKLIGSSFLIGSSGLLLTARHVIEEAIAAKNSAGSKHLIGVVGKASSGKDPGSVVSEIMDFELAPEPFDVAIARTGYISSSFLSLKSVDITVWAEVATMGYPAHAVSGPAEGMNLNLRCLKGYIQRLLSPGDIHIGTHPAAFEISFLMGKGMSGSPLFVGSQPNDIVVGICVGSTRTEIVEDEFIEISSDGASYKEMKLKIEEFGVAHDIRPLLSWKPKILNGRTLQEASEA